LTFEDLSSATGISPQVLAHMADPSQEYHTTTRNLEILSRTFGVRLDQLVEFSPAVEEGGLPIAPSEGVDDNHPDEGHVVT
jgi:hypothetical protein